MYENYLSNSRSIVFYKRRLLRNDLEPMINRLLVYNIEQLIFGGV